MLEPLEWFDGGRRELNGQGDVREREIRLEKASRTGWMETGEEWTMDSMLASVVAAAAACEAVERSSVIDDSSDHSLLEYD